MSKFNISEIFDAINGKVGDIVGTVNKAQPVTVDVIGAVEVAAKGVETLVEFGKDLFAGKDPSPEQIAAVQAIMDELGDRIARS